MSPHQFPVASRVPVYPPASTWNVPAGPAYADTELNANATPVALPDPVPMLLMRTARPAPPASTLCEIVSPETPSNNRMSAVVASVEFWNVLPVIDDPVRLNA